MRMLHHAAYCIEKLLCLMLLHLGESKSSREAEIGILSVGIGLLLGINAMKSMAEIVSMGEYRGETAFGVARSGEASESIAALKLSSRHMKRAGRARRHLGRRH